MSQEIALEYIENGHNLLITGSGGTGKTHVMRDAVTLNTIVCAPTGRAALNIGGVTCHRAFGLPLGLVTREDYKVTRAQLDVLSRADRIIIDEVGMLRADQLDLIDYKMKRAKNSPKPFGGVQLILVGDFLQVDPIIASHEAEHYYKQYASPFAFSAKSFKNLMIVELTEVFRQKDKDHVMVLNSIRKKDESHLLAIDYINSVVKPYDPELDILHLCTTIANAAQINTKWYDTIIGEEYIFQSRKTGKWNQNEIPVPDVQALKVGAKVIICANCKDGKYVNGETGTVVDMGNSGVTVLKSDGTSVFVVRHTWEKFKYKVDGYGGLYREIDARYAQIPLKLGWAVTVHASQGLTLNEMALDVGRGCFTHGQLYVALSRITDLCQLSLVKPISEFDVIVRDEAIAFYDSICNTPIGTYWGGMPK